MKTVLITGASSGFGEAIARKFAANNYRLILNARRQDRLEKLANSLATESFVLPFDVRNKIEVEAALSSLSEDWANINILINNAGLAAGFDKIQDGNVEDWDRMIDTNVKGLLYVSRAIIPGMIKNKSGHIINMGSIAGKEVYEKGNVYCASKHAVDAITKGMRIDLLEHGIKVTSVNPGLAETEFSLVRFHGDKQRADQVYAGYDPLTAEDIADITYFAASRPNHVGINEIVITPLAQANSNKVLRNN